MVKLKDWEIKQKITREKSKLGERKTKIYIYHIKIYTDHDLTRKRFKRY